MLRIRLININAIYMKLALFLLTKFYIFVIIIIIIIIIIKKN